jgi:hypothetical protein
MTENNETIMTLTTYPIPFNPRPSFHFEEKGERETVDTTEPKDAKAGADDVQAKIDAAVAAERERLTKAQQDAEAERERKEAEKRGEWERIAAEEKAKRVAAEQKAAQAEHERAVDRAMDAYLSDPARKEWSAAAKEFAKVSVAVGADANAIAKAVKDGVDHFIKNNPRPSGSGGTPGSHGFKAPAGTMIPKTEPNGQHKPRFTGEALYL